MIRSAMSALPIPVNDGSRLAADRAAAEGFLLDLPTMCEHYLFGADDFLGGLLALMEPRPNTLQLPRFALYPLIRGVIESSGQTGTGIWGAGWLERCSRRLWGMAGFPLPRPVTQPADHFSGLSSPLAAERHRPGVQPPVWAKIRHLSAHRSSHRRGIHIRGSRPPGTRSSAHPPAAGSGCRLWRQESPYARWQDHCPKRSRYRWRGRP